MTLNPADYREQTNYYNVEIFDKHSKHYRGFSEADQQRFERVNENLRAVKVENPIILEYEKDKLLPREKYDKFLIIRNEEGLSLLDIFLTIYEEVQRLTTEIYQDFSEAEFKYLFYRGFDEEEDENGVYYTYVR